MTKQIPSAQIAPIARFKVYPAGFLFDVVGLDAEEIGAYTALHMLAYLHGRKLPCRRVKDLQFLAGKCGLTTRRFRKVLNTLCAKGKFTLQDGAIELVPNDWMRDPR